MFDKVGDPKTVELDHAYLEIIEAETNKSHTHPENKHKRKCVLQPTRKFEGDQNFNKCCYFPLRCSAFFLHRFLI